jgi:hypothetical protein
MRRPVQPRDARRRIDFTDSRQHFIHGILEGFGGTCATLPVLYAAVGRRLGYPLKLASAVEHRFCRWDDPQSGVRFNIEASGRGLGVHADDYYRSWPKSMSSVVEQAHCHLTSLTPQQELAEFYSQRACCYFDCGYFWQSQELSRAAMDLWPEDLSGKQRLAICTVLHLEASGQVLYGLLSEPAHPPERDLVLDHGQARVIESWERSAVRSAKEELSRLKDNQERRRRRRLESAPEIVLPDYSELIGKKQEPILA